MYPGDVWGWRGLWWGFTWRYSIINQGLTMGQHQGSGPVSCLQTPGVSWSPHSHPIAPQSPRPTWSHAEASDDADHAGDADVAHPGQGGLRGDTGLGMLLGLVLSFTPALLGHSLVWWWLLGTVATRDTLVTCRQAGVVRGKAGEGQPQPSPAAHDIAASPEPWSILRKQTAGEGPSTCPGTSQLPPWEQLFLKKKLQEAAGFFSYGFVFSFFVVVFLRAQLTFSLTLKGKHDLEEPAHLSFPCVFLPPGFYPSLHHGAPDFPGVAVTRPYLQQQGDGDASRADTHGTEAGDDEGPPAHPLNCEALPGESRD